MTFLAHRRAMRVRRKRESGNARSRSFNRIRGDSRGADVGGGSGGSGRLVRLQGSALCRRDRSKLVWHPLLRPGDGTALQRPSARQRLADLCGRHGWFDCRRNKPELSRRNGWRRRPVRQQGWRLMPPEGAASRSDRSLLRGQDLYVVKCRVCELMIAAVTVFAVLLSPGAQGQGTPPLNQWQPIAANTTFETGDTWVSNGQRFRLYGVQSCLRETAYTGPDGRKHDCGDASLRMLIALVRTWNPRCSSVARSPRRDATFVVCYAVAATSAGAQQVELGTALIASGFAFAALDENGRPVSLAYEVAEKTAHSSNAGLWAAPDLANPNAILLNALSKARSAPCAKPLSSVCGAR
jgi:endonuclease YncB( thermonuclease family)